ncbi:MAG: AAA domain-containing protein [Labedaea sp.]
MVTAHAQELRALATAAGTTHEALVTAHHTYGEDSAFTAFAARFHPEPLLLDEHYRCHPDIIQFCNTQFYDNRLTVLTTVARTEDLARGLEWQDVDGRTERGPNGNSAINEAEALAVIDWLLASGLRPDQVGVVTPFLAQANLIRKLLRQHGGATFDGMRIGTAHTFQGGERDTMLFSTVIAPGALPGTISWLEGERNLINVAVSRAKQHLVVFGNRTELRRAKANTLLALAAAATGQAARQDPSADDAARSLHAALVSVGLPAVLNGVDEGYRLAITLTTPGGDRINIEVEDYPNGDPRGRLQRQSSSRDNNVRRLGWQVLRVPAWQIHLDPAAAIARVRLAITR